MAGTDGSHKAGRRTLIIVLCDAAILFLCAFAALLTKYAPNIEPDVMGDILIRTPALVLIYLGVFAVFGMYKVLWKYADSYQLLKQGMAAIVGFGISFVLNFAFSFVKGFRLLDNNYLITFCVFAISGIFAFRLAIQNLRRSKPNEDLFSDTSLRRVLIVGAGEAGAHIVEMFNKDREEMGSVEVIVDDDESKRGFKISDVPVAGSTKDIPALVNSYDISDIIIALPTASKERIKEISDICLETGCFVRLMDKLKRIRDSEKDE